MNLGQEINSLEFLEIQTSLPRHCRNRQNLNQTILSLIFLSAFFFCPSVGECQPIEWTITISAQRLDSYLNFTGSILTPVVKTSVYYNQSGQNIHYQDLYYSQGQPIGCRRYSALNVTPGTGGVIAVVKLSNNDQQQGCAVANAAIRTYLDLSIQKSSVRELTVAPDYFDNLIQGLGQCGFQPFEIVPDKPFKAKIVLEVVSNPSGRFQYLYYDDSSS
jgi:hypothetical protein